MNSLMSFAFADEPGSMFGVQELINLKSSTPLTEETLTELIQANLDAAKDACHDAIAWSVRERDELQHEQAYIELRELIGLVEELWEAGCSDIHARHLADCERLSLKEHMAAIYIGRAPGYEANSKGGRL